MIKILKSNLSVSSNMKSVLILDIVDTQNLIDAIQDFVENSGADLKGAGYDDLRSKITKYVEVLNIRKQVAESLKIAIEASFPAMEAFMEDYPDLDDSRLSDINTQVSILENKYNSALASYRSLLYSNNDDSNGVTIDFSDDVIRCKKMASFYKKEKEKLEKLKTKLEALTPTDNDNYAKFNTAISDLNKYKSQTSNLEVSNIQY